MQPFAAALRELFGVPAALGGEHAEVAEQAGGAEHALIEPRGAGRQRRGLRNRLLHEMERGLQAPELQSITAFQGDRDGGHRLAVAQGAVAAAEIAQPPAPLIETEFGMTPRYGRFLDPDVRMQSASEGGDPRISMVRSAPS